MKDIFDFLLKNAIWLALTSVVSYTYIKVKTLTNSYKAVESMTVTLTRVEILKMYERAVEAGFRTDNSSKVFMQLVESYYAAGGNGVVKQIEEDYFNLKLKVNTN